MQQMAGQQLLSKEKTEQRDGRRAVPRAPAVASTAEEMQATLGNHAVLRRCSPAVQAKLTVGQAGDAYEQEADRVAEAVLRMQPGRGEVIHARPIAPHMTLLAQRRAAAGSQAAVPSWGMLPIYAQTELEDKGYSGDWFDRQSAECRLTILNLYVKLRGMHFWEHIRGIMIDETNQFPGRLNFFVRDVRALKQDLRSRWNFRDPEASDTEKWDSAEKRVTGALHFKHFAGWPQDKVEAHIDQAGVWLGSKLFFWAGLPVTLIRHGLTLDSYQDPFGIRTILLEQGWDRQSLLGVAPAAVQRKATPERFAVTPIVQQRVDSLKGRGQPLPAAVRAFFEPRFGHDFRQVRVHTGVEAAETARAMNAVAYTVGHDVAFGAGQYAPDTAQGRRLLAHELTHVLQQTSPLGGAMSTDAAVSHAAEAQANGLADRFTRGERVGADLPIAVRAGTIQREQIGTRVTHPAGSRSPYRTVTATYDGREFVAMGDGREILRASAQSGRPYTVLPADAARCGGSPDDSYMNNPRYVGIADNGPIPEGEFRFRVTEMATFGAWERLRMLTGGSYTDPFGRPLHGGDWGAGRVALRKISVRPGPRGCGNTASRAGFYLHGGIMPGSSGCIDIGNSGFTRLVELLMGYTGQVRVTVRYRHPAPAVGRIDRALGRFTYPPGRDPGVWDRLRSLFGMGD